MSVSILIPAFRPTYLRQAIESALGQGTDDFELLISDDSGAEELRPIVETFNDPRIRYLRTPHNLGDTGNCAFLWAEARYDLIAYLLDDDLLLPGGLSALVAQAKAHPDAAFYFGNRHIIDAAGALISDTPTLLVDKIVMSQVQLSTLLVGRMQNKIGEFSNILINRAVGVTADDFVHYMGVPALICGDVAFYINASRLGPAVGVKQPVAAFRQHGDQQSSPTYNPMLAVGICEWELFLRGEYSVGRLTQPLAAKAVESLLTGYAHWSVTLPIIDQMMPGAHQLRSQILKGETAVLDQEFRDRWARFVALVKAGKLSNAGRD